MKKFILLAAALIAAFGAQAKENVLKSPDGRIVVTVSCGENVSYSVERDGIKLLAPSQISMMLIGGYKYGGKDNLSTRRFPRRTSSGPKSGTTITK